MRQIIGVFLAKGRLMNKNMIGPFFRNYYTQPIISKRNTCSNIYMLIFYTKRRYDAPQKESVIVFSDCIPLFTSRNQV